MRVLLFFSKCECAKRNQTNEPEKNPAKIVRRTKFPRFNEWFDLWAVFLCVFLLLLINWNINNHRSSCDDHVHNRPRCYIFHLRSKKQHVCEKKETHRKDTFGWKIETKDWIFPIKCSFIWFYEIEWCILWSIIKTVEHYPMIILDMLHHHLHHHHHIYMYVSFWIIERSVLRSRPTFLRLKTSI